jgi:hypothetical protein
MSRGHKSVKDSCSTANGWFTQDINERVVQPLVLLLAANVTTNPMKETLEM